MSNKIIIKVDDFVRYKLTNKWIYFLDMALDKFNSQELDMLYSINSDGEKNGAHYILKTEGIRSGLFLKTSYIVDDCTNVHDEADLKLAETRMKSVVSG